MMCLSSKEFPPHEFLRSPDMVFLYDFLLGVCEECERKLKLLFKFLMTLFAVSRDAEYDTTEFLKLTP